MRRRSYRGVKHTVGSVRQAQSRLQAELVATYHIGVRVRDHRYGEGVIVSTGLGATQIMCRVKFDNPPNHYFPEDRERNMSHYALEILDADA